MSSQPIQNIAALRDADWRVLDGVIDCRYVSSVGGPQMDCNQRFAGIEKRLDGMESHMDSIDSRMDKLDMRMGQLEVHMDSMDANISEMKVDIRDLRIELKSNFKWTVGILVTSLLAIVGAMFVIDQRQESWIQHSVNQIQSANQAFIESNNAANRALLEQIDKRHSEQNRILQLQIDQIKPNSR